MLDKYRDTGKFKPYLIFGLCDETFSILCSTNPPEGVNRNWFMFFITLLNHSYWVLGSALGGLLGYMVSFNTKGLDFVLTALFVVIFIGQWKTQRNHGPAIIGVLCSVVCLIIFGRSNFIIPSMFAILAVLTVFRKKMTGGGNSVTLTPVQTLIIILMATLGTVITRFLPFYFILRQKWQSPLYHLSWQCIALFSNWFACGVLPERCQLAEIAIRSTGGSCHYLHCAAALLEKQCPPKHWYGNNSLYVSGPKGFSINDKNIYLSYLYLSYLSQRMSV